MNPQAWGSFAPGLFRICGSFFCFAMPEKNLLLATIQPAVGRLAVLAGHFVQNPM